MRLARLAIVAWALGLTAVPASGVIIDRIAATVDDQPITTSEIDQFAIVRIIERREGEGEDEYRRRILDYMIAQILRARDVNRFGSAEVSTEDIANEIAEIRSRFSSPEGLEAALAEAEMTMPQLEAVVRRNLQVEAFIAERFSPMIFVSLEDIERYYQDVWIDDRIERGAEILPLGTVREEIRAILKSTRLDEEVGRWTTELRGRADIDVYL
ncbi:MAG: SurA N-terminal domain-containing protein [Acidobacteria bacterium]|nr:SurA N-terminal domain-containing protein [Acidobacteriota bacterium]